MMDYGCLGAPRAAYVHVPFCISKCFYCDFNSFAGMDSLFEDYVVVLMEEIRRTGAHAPEHKLPMDSVYFGGGTPTVLGAGSLAGVLNSLRASLGVAEDAEVTLEANPGTVDEYKLVELFAAGFNRLSLGVQSLEDAFLQRLGRVHSVKQALNAYEAARNAGFANVGIDLMFALPGQTLDSWSRTLDAAIDLAPQHISLYELSIEDGTRFAQMCATGQLDLPGEDEQIDMYELTIAKLTAAGYEHYEVSNFARSGFRSRHNSVYWRNEPYYGFGAGATSYVNGDRNRRIGSPKQYIDAINTGSDAIEFSEHLVGREWLAESVGLGLRVLDGIDLIEFDRKTGVNLLAEFDLEIPGLIGRGLVEIINGRLRVTHRGLLLLNDVIQEFLPDS